MYVCMLNICCYCDILLLLKKIGVVSVFTMVVTLINLILLLLLSLVCNCFILDV